MEILAPFTDKLAWDAVVISWAHKAAVLPEELFLADTLGQCNIQESRPPTSYIHSAKIVKSALEFLLRRTPVKWILLALLVASNASAKSNELEAYVLQKVLSPWVAAHYPNFHYVGKDSPDGGAFSWSFQDVSDPKLRKTFPLSIRMDFVRTESTARRYFHGGDKNLAEALRTTALLESGRVPTRIGDESEAFDIRETGNHRAQGDMGGWIRCRVGTCLFFVHSYSMTFEDLKDLSESIVKALPRIPEPSINIRKKGETGFLKEISGIEQSEREEDEYKERVKTKTLVTAGELYENYFKEHPAPEIKYDEHGLSPGARSHSVKPGVSEINIERSGCFGTCPQYAVKITSNGKVEYFGGRFVPRLGNHIGHVPEWKVSQLSEFVKDAGVDQMRDEYECAVTDSETVYTAFVIDGKQKVIRNYANSGPSSLWAIEQLIDKLLAETAWETTDKKKQGK